MLLMAKLLIKYLSTPVALVYFDKLLDIGQRVGLAVSVGALPLADRGQRVVGLAEERGGVVVEEHGAELLYARGSVSLCLLQAFQEARLPLLLALHMPIQSRSLLHTDAVGV